MTAKLGAVAVGALVAVAAITASAGEAEIRSSLTERVPSLPKIDEVNRTAIPSLYEVRMGTTLYYTDEGGNYLIRGEIVDIKSGANLTQARLDKITVIDVAALDLKDAIVWKRGNGLRKLVVFADPNCGYCKRFERELQIAKDLTVYTFLYPILGGDSAEKARDVWCAADRTKAWRSWMLDGVAPPRNAGACDAGALGRNRALGARHRISGTPALVFENGKRVPGMVRSEELEQNLRLALRRSK